MAPNCPTCGQPIPAQDDPVARFRVGMRVRWSMKGQRRLGTVSRIQAGGAEIVVAWDDKSAGIYDAPWFRTGRATLEPLER